MITQEELKELVSYNPETGELTGLQDLNKRVRKDELIRPYINPDGYYEVRLRGLKKYRVHKLIWLYCHGILPDYSKGELIDHIDRDRTNNKIENLRLVDHKGNSKNIGLSKRNTSGIKGVSWNRQCNKWEARISNRRIAFFSNMEDAVAARLAKEKELGYL